jgi:ribose-phosphate pyrophosphokinase
MLSLSRGLWARLPPLAAAAAATAATTGLAFTWLQARSLACEGEEEKSDPVLPGIMTQKMYYWGGTPRNEDLKSLMILGGSQYPEMAAAIANLLGIKPARCTLGTYVDGECQIQVNDPILGRDVFLVSPTQSNSSLVELLLLISTMKRCGAKRITAVIPYYGYARQDRRYKREPVAAADVALMLESMGVDRILTVDLHSGQIQGYFTPATPVDNVMPFGVAAGYFSEYIRELDATKKGLPGKRIAVVASQEGQVNRANAFAEKLQSLLGPEFTVSLAFVTRSSSSRDTTSTSTEKEDDVGKYLIGDVKGTMTIIVDDMVTTGATMQQAVKMLSRGGAARITAVATHARFSGRGEELIQKLDELEFLAVCNTVPHRDEAGRLIDWGRSGKIRELNLAPLLAEAVFRLHRGIPFPELVYDLDHPEEGRPCQNPQFPDENEGQW